MGTASLLSRVMSQNLYVILSQRLLDLKATLGIRGANERAIEK
jgi:hypothetical protein